MCGVGVGKYCGQYTMPKREGHEVFETRAEERENSHQKGKCQKGKCSSGRRCRNDTKKRNLRIFSTPDTFRLVQHAFQPIIKAPNTTV